MEKWKKRLIALHHCPYLNDSAIINFIKMDPTLETLQQYPPLEISRLTSLSQDMALAAIDYMNSPQFHRLLDIYQKEKIRMLTIFDEEYPLLLKEIYDPPLVLYTKGSTDLMKARILGVVGTRNMTENGRLSLQKLVPPLVKEGFVTVSGLAKGVDTVAHRLTMEHKGSTIAVLGSGLMKIYPKENQKLADYIAAEHLLISEYPPFTSPQKWHFPKRNRIISGLSEGVIIIEAKEKSGSLITADQALEQSRDVFAVPGSIVEPTATGTNSLIQQGATLVMSHHDILNELR
ncbi:DNA processing protein [Bacillus tianshenii]|uniref:DNA processing protein n=1 Tax=Sutcliffiella tianshenii TaxID=1463404 RepID=A0ABS2NWD8_9BACI|nr:DNA-processing protein DprA [Bacillus tianshenii]MBM7618975.1 DNA processing protein [Bacillus tianshenii]